MFERFLENLGLKCLLTEKPVQLANLVLQGSVIRRRHNLFATAGCGQAALCHQAAPGELLVRGNAMAGEPPSSPSYPARRSPRPSEPSPMPSSAADAEPT